MRVLLYSFLEITGVADIVSTIMQFQYVNVVHNITILRVPRRPAPAGLCGTPLRSEYKSTPAKCKGACTAKLISLEMSEVVDVARVELASEIYPLSGLRA